MAASQRIWAQWREAHPGLEQVRENKPDESRLQDALTHAECFAFFRLKQVFDEGLDSSSGLGGGEDRVVPLQEGDGAWGALAVTGEEDAPGPVSVLFFDHPLHTAVEPASHGHRGVGEAQRVRDE